MSKIKPSGKIVAKKTSAKKANFKVKTPKKAALKVKTPKKAKKASPAKINQAVNFEVPPYYLTIGGGIHNFYCEKCSVRDWIFCDCPLQALQALTRDILKETPKKAVNKNHCECTVEDCNCPGPIRMPKSKKWMRVGKTMYFLFTMLYSKYSKH